MTTIKHATHDSDLPAPLMTDAEVLDRVSLCVDQRSGSGRWLWIMFIDRGGVQLPAIFPLSGLPEVPERTGVQAVCQVIAHVLRDAAPGGSAVISLARAGTGQVRESDRRWATALRTAAAAEGATLRMVCLATTDGVRQLDH